MSINSCSINEYTINTLCGRRRQAIIDSLRPHPPVVGVGGGSVQHVRNLDRMQNVFDRRDTEREEQIDVNTLEQMQMSVTIEMAGQTYTQMLERETMVPVVSVYSLSASAEVEEQVNISDLNIRIL
jgi:hypothetical protein